ncbi:unnamed protein product [Ceutorhynchus assimilis]|uniref:DUF19 domain-containing protein n=1 Tax=Ceutorhynchus assimilis TaxID=467358 RepID=A0A9P0DK48_9CUCU|nr:unnamed protein product [Ceutorhynchus assimilis]
MWNLCKLVVIFLLFDHAYAKAVDADDADACILLSETCKREEAIYILQDQVEVHQRCLSLYMDLGSRSLSENLGNYCNKMPYINECAQLTIRAGAPNPEGKCFLKIFGIIKDFQNFLCSNSENESRLAMFITAGGVECIKEHPVENCFDEVLDRLLLNTQTDLSIANLAIFIFTTLDCQEFNKIHTCMEEVLEKCEDTAPAMLVDASFEFIKNQTDCRSEIGVAVKVFLVIGTYYMCQYTIIAIIIKTKFYMRFSTRRAPPINE